MEFTLQFVNRTGDIVGREYFANEEASVKFAEALIKVYEKEDNNIFALFLSFPDEKEEMLWERDTEHICINCP